MASDVKESIKLSNNSIVEINYIKVVVPAINVYIVW